MWHSLYTVVGPDLAQAPQFATAQARKRNEAELDAVLSAWTTSRDRWQITDELQAVGVAAFPSLTPTDLWTGDRHLEARGMLERPLHPVTGDLVVPGVPWRLTHGANGLRRPAPMLGQHTHEVLTQVLGYSCDAVAELVAHGVVHDQRPTAPQTPTIGIPHTDRPRHGPRPAPRAVSVGAPQQR